MFLLDVSGKISQFVCLCNAEAGCSYSQCATSVPPPDAAALPSSVPAPVSGHRLGVVVDRQQAPPGSVSNEEGPGNSPTRRREARGVTAGDPLPSTAMEKTAPFLTKNSSRPVLDHRRHGRRMSRRGRRNAVVDAR